jgi:ArsR family transcriptional regulator
LDVDDRRRRERAVEEPHPPPCCEDGLIDPGPLDEERIAQIAKGLAHPARVRIIEQFVECRPHTATEIVEGCILAQSTVSEHLRILREADIVFATKDGPRVWYCLRRSVLRRYADAVTAMTEGRGTEGQGTEGPGSTEYRVLQSLSH